MKYFNSKLPLLFVICLFFIKCSKSKDEAPTEMKLIVIDNMGNRVPGAEVSFSHNPYIYPGSSNTLISDVNGVVLFSNISNSQFYYIFAEKDCKNNLGDTSFPRFLTLHTLNNDSVVIYDKGVLKIINTTSESYNISSPFFNQYLQPNSQYVYNSDIGNYVVHSEQSNMPGSGRDTIMHITCGDSSVITIPY